MTRFTPPCDGLEAFYTIALPADLDTAASFGSGAAVQHWISLCFLLAAEEYLGGPWPRRALQVL